MNLNLKAAVVAVVAVAGLSSQAKAQMQPGVPLVALGYCQLSTLSSSTALSSCAGGIPAGANVAFFKAETQALRWRDDGTAPTATVGMPMAIADPALSYTGPLSNIRFIEQTASGKLNVEFYKAP